MSENLDPLLAKAPDQIGPQESVEPSGRVTVELPPVLSKLVQQCSQQSGQTEAAVIVALLKSAFGLMPDDVELAVELQAVPLSARLQIVEARLGQLESLEGRLKTLEGKSLAF